MQNITHASPNRPLAMLLKRAHMLVLIVLEWSDLCSTRVRAVF